MAKKKEHTVEMNPVYDNLIFLKQYYLKMTLTVKNEHRWMNGLISFSIRAAAYVNCLYF